MDVKYLVVHCSDSPDDVDIDAEEIHRWHKQRGWDGIGYHAVILRNGTIEQGRPNYWIGSHVRGHNSESLGVCLVGKRKFSDAQMTSLRFLMNAWQTTYKDSEIIGHCDLDSKKTCPNFDVKEWWNS